MQIAIERCRDKGVQAVTIAYVRTTLEQEPVAWTWQGTLDRLKNDPCPEGEIVWPHGSPGAPIPLYTHANPSEVVRLRAEVETIRSYLSEAVDGLAEAKALIPDFGGKSRMDAWRKWLPKFIDRIGYEKKPNRNFLSATAQPTNLIERGSSHGFDQSPNACRHDRKEGVWWREGAAVRTGRECVKCGLVDEDPVLAQPADGLKSDE